MNISRLTEEYIEGHPHILSSLKNSLINYSSLARTIISSNNLDMKNFDAILIACRRYKQKLSSYENEKEVISLLKKSSIQTKNRVCAFVLQPDIPFVNIEIIEKKIRKDRSPLRIIESSSAVTLLVPDDYSDLVRKTFKNTIIKESHDLVEITLKTSEQIENIPGVLSFLYSRLAYSGINVMETFSCWTDTIFIINEKDLSKVMNVFTF